MSAAEALLGLVAVACFAHPWWVERRIAKVRRRLLDVSGRTIPALSIVPLETARLRRAIDRAVLESYDLLLWGWVFQPSVRYGDASPETNPHLAPLFRDVVRGVEDVFRIRYPLTYWAAKRVKGPDWVTGYARRVVRHLGTYDRGEV